MSKRASGSRQRRRASSPATMKDPFHNGQTPACGELLIAIQDVFPELQQQNQKQKPSSDLGKLLRWQYLENRKARMLPPPPPLADSPPETLQQEESGSSAKKKKKRKKKKKQDSITSTDVKRDDSVEQNEEDDADANSSDDKSLDQSLDLETIEKPSSNEERHPDQNPSKPDIHDEQNPMNSSMYLFDQIRPEIHTHEMLSPTQFIKQIRPEKNALPGVPSLDDEEDEDGSPQNQDDFMFSPTQFLQQMPSQTTSRIPSITSLDSEDKDEAPPSPKATPISNGDGMVTPSHSQTAANEAVLNSPTHEWVPEESAESKVETPPGDAIKDPLTLPYLLTLSEDNGTTTTTIDGSLISAARATDEEPSRIETTRVLFEEWLEQLDHDQKDNRKKDYKSFVDFLQARLHGGNHPLGIPLQTLQDACSNVACYPCRQEATAEVEKMRVQGIPIVLNTVCLLEESKAQTGAAVDSAFDYVALEEGHHTPAPQVEEEEPDLKTSLSFALSEAKTKASAPAGTPQLYLQAVTSKHLDTLAEHWLPCGIEEDVMVTTVVQDESSQLSEHQATKVLNSEEMRKIQEKVLVNEKDARVALDGIHSVKTALLKDIDQIASTSSSSRAPNVEFKLFPILKQCDHQCISLMDESLQILRSTSSENHHALADLQMHLWTSYLGTLNKALKACNAYYTKVEDHADQRGVLPKMFVSADLRGLYQTLVEDKTKAWTELSNVFSKNLSSRVLKEYFTRSVWDECKSQSQVETSPLDQDCHELLNHMSNWTETILGGRMSDIFKHRIAQTESVLELLQKVVEPLAEQYATVERYFSTERNVYFANLRSQIVLVLGVKKQMRLLDQTEVECMAMAVLLMWRHTRTMQSRMITSKEIPTLPLQLKRWMLQDDRGFDEWRNSPLHSTATPHQMFCRPGTGGKRRAMCVLAGLVYQWLGDRCREWRAEMAEKELLTDFMAESTSASNVAANGGENQNKSSKKKKKKKKKGAASPQNASENGNTTPTSAGDESNGNINGRKKQGDNGEKQHDAQNGTNKDQGVIWETVKTANGKTKSTTPVEEEEKSGTARIASEEKTEDPPSEEDETTPYDDIDDFPTSVYVKDDKDITSGRDFLIGRLRDLLSNTDGKQVVFVQH
jgi:hypothetical protein